MNKLVSVIVACYNHAPYLSDAVESIISQAYTEWECIIINDGSTDHTETVAMELVKKDSRISYYRIENSGVSFARNFAIARSSGLYILPLDADDRIHPTYIEKAVGVFQQCDVKLVYCEIELFGAATGIFKLPDYTPSAFAAMNMILGNSVFKREDFIRAGGYNVNMKYGWEDWDLFISFLENGGSVFKIPEVLFYYRIQAGSRTKKLEGARKQKMFMQLYLNHPEFFDRFYQNPIEIFPEYQDLRNSQKKLDTLKGLIKLKPAAYKLVLGKFVKLLRR